MNNKFELQRIITLKLETLQDTIHNDINLLYFVNAETEEQRNQIAKTIEGMQTLINDIENIIKIGE